ncbi:Biofilm PGA synthesis auxiliary protein PgaD [Caballeronia glathei]|jgi:hypothetical protein|uniref:Poly-beta-1,6-N-acetyl-D-glucosamine biosynthesis protein PgaD n=1 Tax=Caballeronia glathei TaxID=60547 RepID=A0A069PWL8_9BURK|nr:MULTISPECIES: hypothetical protein [Burkholderiaceae]KDR44214.1 hypothetical protein BG61_19305 [Caballeronia glathei]TCK34634.1 hypothetical protein B0G84_6592 [Paraburkholderia sp. BL8N3]CDY77493.1 Biofilm PGA synthesis auxiliary protein PgaD [Caballeronia glathei]
MTFPIIDVSKQTVEQFKAQNSHWQAVRYVAWYRLARPVLVLSMWLLAAYYMRWCLTNASPGELSLEALMPSLLGIATVGGALILWTIGRQVDQGRSNRVRAMPMMAEPLALEAPHGIALDVDAGRRLVAYHDDDGLISHVISVPEAVRQAA